MRKRTILCFGDSNTWGFNIKTKSRFPEEIRWTGILQALLGDRYKVIEEGQNGRTIATDDPAEGEKNGLKYIGPCMETHMPFDLIIIMLGTNDLKTKFGYCSRDVAGEMQILLEKVKSFNHFRMKDKAKILLVSPALVGENIEDSWLATNFDGLKTRKVSKELADWYKQLSEMYDTEFLDAAQYVEAGDPDSIHLDAENHHKLAEVMCEKIKEIFG